MQHCGTDFVCRKTSGHSSDRGRQQHAGKVQRPGSCGTEVVPQSSHRTHLSNSPQICGVHLGRSLCRQSLGDPTRFLCLATQPWPCGNLFFVRPLLPCPLLPQQPSLQHTLKSWPLGCEGP